MTRRHADFLGRMVEKLPTTALPDGRRPLAALTTRDPSDPILALLDAWSMVCEGLSFSAERVAEECTLATASERAMRLFALQLGHDTTPPLAATTWLAFTVQEEAGGQPTVRIPAGTRVDSLPEQDRAPQPFETDEDLEARAVWNRMLPLRTPIRAPWQAQAGADTLLLDGVGLALRPGELLLLRGEHDSRVVQLRAARAEAATGCTVLAFEPPLDRDLDGVQVFPLRRRAGLHGRDAEEWLGLSREQRLALATASVAVTAVRPDGAEVLARRADGLARRVRDGAPATLPAATLPADAPRQGHAGGLTAAAKRADGRWLTGGAEGLVLVHDGAAVTVIGRGEPVGSVAWDEGGLTALSGHADGVVQRWAVDAPDPLHPLDQWEPFPLTELQPDWPEPTLRPGELWLDGVLPELRLDDAVVLTRETPVGPMRAAARVRAAEVQVSGTYGRVVRVTRLELDPAPDGALLDRKSTELWLCQAPLALATTELPRPDLAAGARVVPLASSPGPLPLGRRAILRGRTPTGEAHAALVRLSDRSGPGGYAVGIEPPLTAALTLDSAEILANLAPATHGETVDEVLGGGDGTRAHQQMRPARAPLAFVATGDGRAWRAMIEVRVDGIPWTALDSLSHAGPDDRVYALSRDADERVRVRFGDGVRGARLPTRADNVTARYRTGGGPDGLVGADRITLLRSHPLGVASATNPLPTTGGRAADGIERVRVQAPASVLTLDRLVSLNDYGHYATAFAGVVSALATAVETPAGPLVHISVHGVEEGPAEALLVAALERAIDTLSDPAQNARVDACRRVPFGVELRLLGAGQPAPVAAVREALLSRFAMGALRPARTVSVDAIEDAAGSVPGVRAARVVWLGRAEGPATDGELRAQNAAWSASARAIRPAEILGLDPNQLRVEEDPA